MDTNTIFILLAYYIGIASCAAQGAEKGQFDNSIPLLRYISNAFGGGLVRDAFFLGVQPWILTLSALPDLLFVVFVGIVYTYCFSFLKLSSKYHNTAMQVVTIADSIGSGAFIYKGMNQAFIFSENIFVIILCGYITTIAGGLIASGKLLTESFKSKKTAYYHIVILIGCCHYYLFRHPICLVIFTTFGLSLVKADYYSCFVNLMTICYKVYILYLITDYSGQQKRQKIINLEKKPQACSEQVRIYIMQHRIRQC